MRAHGYRPRRLDEVRQQGQGKCLFLRFDVDISPINARVLGRLAAAQGWPASFLFQLNAETYNALGPATLDTIRELRSLGHCVGLHIDQRLSGEDEAPIARTLAWFRRCVVPIEPVVSFHRPTASVLGRSYRRFASAYAPEAFAPERYLSDSRRSLAFVPTLRAWLAQGRSPIQLLLHPEWWQESEGVEAIWQEVRARRARELESYLVENFNKVFGHLTVHEDRDFRL
jgi:hypothetical protein